MNDNYTYKFGNTTYDLSSRTHIMGILNVTPDSFSDGGKYYKPEDAVRHGIEMSVQGADFIDVGGMSTKPGSDEIPLDEELNRIVEVVRLLKDKIEIPISVDTYRSKVAEEALKNGAVLVNDISGFTFDENMAATVKKYNASAVLMHIKGRPKDMQIDPKYDDLIGEVHSYFEKSIWKANVNGIDQIIIDPGIGFGKTPEHNLQLIKHISEFKKLDCPIMVGLSKKMFISKLTGALPEERLYGTLSLNTATVLNGVNIVRVHDVRETFISIQIIDELKKTK
jgi:dihydropteroate synthase